MSFASLILLGLATVFLAAFGAGVYTWTTCAVAVLLTSAHAWMASRAACKPIQAGPSGRFSGIEAVYVGILLLFVITLLPVPLRFSCLAGSPRAEQNSKAAAAIEQAAGMKLAAHPLPWFSLTRNRAGTLRMTTLALAAFAAAMMASLLSRRDRRTWLRFLALFGTALAIAGGIAQWIVPQGDTLWWLIPIPHGLPGPVACFINRNHFGGFLALLCPAVLALCMDDLSKRRWLGAALCIAAFAAMSAGVTASLSRGAMLAYAAGLFAAALMFIARRRLAVSLCLLLTGTAIAFGILHLPIPGLNERIRTLKDPLSTPSAQARMAAWRDTLTVWRTYPLVGAGANALRMVYPQHRTTSVSGYRTYAENEYVQLLAETGLAGALLAVALALAVRRHSRSVPGDAPPDPAIGVAVGGALAAAAVNACYDFPMHVPLYALTLATLVGLLLSAPDAGLPWPARWADAMRSHSWPALGSLLLALLLSAMWVDMQNLDSTARPDKATADELARTLVWSPTSWQAWYYLGRQACVTPRGADPRFGEHCISQAAAYDPMNYKLWKELGTLRLSLNDRTGARAAFQRVKQLRYWVQVPPVPDQ